MHIGSQHRQSKKKSALTLFSRGLVILLCFVAVASFKAQQPSHSDYTATEVMVPMRDGLRLYTQVYAPASAAERLPILLLRTPYGTGGLNPAGLAASIPELAADGYIFVSQDIRGRYGREGQVIMNHPLPDPVDACCC